MKKFFGSIWRFFRGGGAERAFDKFAEIVPKAYPLVQFIAVATPNRTDDEIAEVYQRYGVQLVRDIKAVPADQRGGLLLDLATSVLASRYPGTPTDILRGAAQLAYDTYKASRGR